MLTNLCKSDNPKAPEPSLLAPTPAQGIPIAGYAPTTDGPRTLAASGTG